jgi:hypothetical protein
MFASQPAAAACFESGVDCTDDHDIPAVILDSLSCDALWTVRNMIFDENGYCFQTAKAKAVFSNDGCQFTSMTAMPLNQYEAANIQTIRQVEKQKACY